MTQDELKRQAARAALAYVLDGEIVGVGTGSTTWHFMDALAELKGQVRGAVPSSEATSRRLRDLGLPVLELAATDQVSVYVDGADEADSQRRLIKGGGGALTREKVIAAASQKFVCIIDETKLVEALGKFPLPVEVLPMARAHVAAVLSRMGGEAVPRVGFVTDNGNEILDVSGLNMADPGGLEAELDQIPGVVGNGLFANRPADVLLVGTSGGLQRLG